MPSKELFQEKNLCSLFFQMFWPHQLCHFLFKLTLSVTFLDKIFTFFLTFPDIFSKIAKMPIFYDFSLTGKVLLIFPGFPDPVRTLVVEVSCPKALVRNGMGENKRTKLSLTVTSMTPYKTLPRNTQVLPTPNYWLPVPLFSFSGSFAQLYWPLCTSASASSRSLQPGLVFPLQWCWRWEGQMATKIQQRQLGASRAGKGLQWCKMSD